MYELRMLVPNGLTATRCVSALVLPFAYWFHTNPLWFLWQTDYKTGLLGLAVAAALTDLFDGWSARQLNCVSALGKKFDSFADALFCIGVIATVLIDGGMSIYAIVFYWIPIAWAVPYTVRVSAMRLSGRIDCPNWDAKCAMACLMFAGSMLFGRIAFNDPIWMEVVGVAAAFWGLYFQSRAFRSYRRFTRYPRSLSARIT